MKACVLEAKNNVTYKEIPTPTPKENEVLIKIALPITNSKDREHIYFKLISFENEKFKAELIQSPYADVRMQKGDVGYFTIDDVSDWLVYTEQGTIYPSHVYLLEE